MDRPHGNPRSGSHHLAWLHVASAGHADQPLAGREPRGRPRSRFVGWRAGGGARPRGSLENAIRTLNERLVSASRPMQAIGKPTIRAPRSALSVYVLSTEFVSRDRLTATKEVATPVGVRRALAR